MSDTRVQFNTGNMYGPNGQPIVAELVDDGIIFRDMARNISGLIKVNTNDLKEGDIEAIVRNNYVYDYNYTVSDRRARKLMWED